MSGIAGVIDLGLRSGRPLPIERMLEPMRHRGPDAQHSWASDRVALGHTLLVTTPEAAVERQPWRHPASGCVLVCDCRLDNRPELLRALGLVHATADEIGDCELLHAAYQEWGEDCAEHLLGDFAFALWDPGKQSLYCARDVMGVKPFVYHFGAARLFAFASDTRSLLSLGEIPADLDEGRIADALVGELEGIDDTSTFFSTIKRLPPAHTLVLGNGSLRLRRYWHPLQSRPSDLPRTEGEWIEAQLFSLTEAVRCRLRGTHRVGSMLSGGLDSSAVVAVGCRLLSGQGRPPLAVFSAIDSERSCAETDSIRSVLSALDVDATLTDVHRLGVFARVQHQFWNEMGEPFDGTMALVSAQYHAAAAVGVRSLLDGMPADNLYTTNDFAARMSRAGHPLRAYALSLATHRVQQNSVPRLRAAKAVVGAWAPKRLRDWRAEFGAGRFYRKELLGGSLIAPEFADRISLRHRFSRYRQEMASKVFRDESGEALTSMTAAYITAAIERYGRAASYHGIEPRHPYLDRRLIEFHAWMPQSLRFRGEWPKWILRKAVERMLPADVVWRRGKTHLGFRFNHEVMRQNPETVVRGCDEAAPYLDAGRTKAALADFDGVPDCGAPGLERAMLMGLWLRSYHCRAGLETFASESSRSSNLAL